MENSSSEWSDLREAGHLIFAGMMSIASVGIKLDSFAFPDNPLSDEQLRKRTRAYVLRNLLDAEERQASIVDALPMLARLAVENKEFRLALEELNSWARTSQATAETLDGRFSAPQLGDLYRLVREIELSGQNRSP